MLLESETEKQECLYVVHFEASQCTLPSWNATNVSVIVVRARR